MSRPIDADKLLQEVKESRKRNPHKDSKIAFNHETEQLHFMRLVSRQSTACDMEQKAIDCMVQHIKTFHEQAMDEVVADYGEPCQTCPHIKECNFDWISVMHPILSESTVKISMLIQEPEDRLDNDDIHPAPDKDIH